ncbi:MAG: hypothetical protein NXH88_10365 [Hyphomonas sp.]|nr:hypothetical protein [Hyphomonas sp.]
MLLYLNSPSIARKRAAYDALIRSKAYRDHWGIPNLKLNLVTRQPAQPSVAA